MSAILHLGNINFIIKEETNQKTVYETKSESREFLKNFCQVMYILNFIIMQLIDIVN